MLAAAKRYWTAPGLADRAAIAVSGLCLLHCVATVLLLGLLSSAGMLLLDPLFHQTGFVLAITIGCLALGNGFLRHRLVLPVAIGSAGIGCLALALALGHGGAEIALTMAGVSLLALAHLLNGHSASSRCAN